MRVHLGTNSLLTMLPMIVLVYMTYSGGLLNWGYLKGLEAELAFTIGFLSVLLGLLCFKFWKLGGRSVFSLHLLASDSVPASMVKIFVFRDMSLVLGAYGKLKQHELKPLIRKLACVTIFFCILLNTLDNRGFNKILTLPENYLSSNDQYCPDKAEEKIEREAPKQGCALLIKAYQLGYAKDLGRCAPKKISPEALSVCTKRRLGEPYLHYAARLIMDASKGLRGILGSNEIERIEQKMALQWDKKEALKDYQLYAMSAAPRASHHIWTNLPYPDSEIYQTLLEIFSPSHCLYEFQNQTNTVSLEPGDERNNSKLLQHVYGQLLFNPKVKRSVAFCKEYQIHWQADENTCERLSESPEVVLSEYGVLSDVKLVLKRHDTSHTISQLDSTLRAIDMNAGDVARSATTSAPGLVQTGRSDSTPIDTSKIAKNKRLRDKKDLVSFNCFMQKNDSSITSAEQTLSLDKTELSVRTHNFPAVDSLGEAQVSMYKQFSKSLEKHFHYSQYTSRSELELQQTPTEHVDNNNREELENSTYRLARLEMLNDVDIFLGNEWVLERDDLLEVYPFHLHLQNYVESFRVEYQKNHGRL